MAQSHVNQTYMMYPITPVPKTNTVVVVGQSSVNVCNEGEGKLK